MTEMILTKLLLLLALAAAIIRYANWTTGNLEAPAWVVLVFAIALVRILYLGFRERFRKDSSHE